MPLSIDEVAHKLDTLTRDHNPDHIAIQAPDDTIYVPTDLEYDDDSSTIWIKTEEC